jgi:hypothetical protein
MSPLRISYLFRGGWEVTLEIPEGIPDGMTEGIPDGMTDRINRLDIRAVGALESSTGEGGARARVRFAAQSPRILPDRSTASSPAPGTIEVVTISSLSEPATHLNGEPRRVTRVTPPQALSSSSLPFWAGRFGSPRTPDPAT